MVSRLPVDILKLVISGLALGTPLGNGVKTFELCMSLAAAGESCEESRCECWDELSSLLRYSAALLPRF
jgi:hypothetical protein